MTRRRTTSERGLCDLANWCCALSLRLPKGLDAFSLLLPHTPVLSLLMLFSPDRCCLLVLVYWCCFSFVSAHPSSLFVVGISIVTHEFVGEKWKRTTLKIPRNSCKRLQTSENYELYELFYELFKNFYELYELFYELYGIFKLFT